MRSYGSITILVTTAVCLLGAGTALAQTCTTDEDCADLSDVCYDAVCSLPAGVCVADPHPADSPCPIGNCREGRCDGSGTCVDVGQSPAGTPCDDGVLCTLNQCDDMGFCSISEPNPDPACNLYSCDICTFSNCTTELGACSQDPGCASFLTCMDTCTSTRCLEACADLYPGTGTDAVFSCMQSSCTQQCFAISVPAMNVSAQLLMTLLILLSACSLFYYTARST